MLAMEMQHELRERQSLLREMREVERAAEAGDYEALMAVHRRYNPPGGGHPTATAADGAPGSSHNDEAAAAMRIQAALRSFTRVRPPRSRGKAATTSEETCGACDDEDEEAGCCSICLEALHPPPPGGGQNAAARPHYGMHSAGLQHAVVALPCAHQFHKRCITNCVQKGHARCPNCRYDLTSQRAAC